MPSETGSETKTEPSIRLPSRITPAWIAFIAGLLFLADRAASLVNKWADEREAWARRIERWDETSKAFKDANIPALKEQQATIWTEIQAMKARAQ